ncbi:MAG: glycosyltransferase family 2 protein [Gammaproteobacteria bacterium]|nr:glycosyltransferase family 2 protein [Gammaproteobacteria bacterium]MCW8983222.1 glycosyltransferase family 2 protein [Gammaproteobacteria bacterium]
MTTLSIVLIVKDESENITPCLESASFADEIVVVDAGSQDDTLELAAKYTDKIIVESDWQGYGIQRQRAQGYATGEWVLMLDADERITPELRESICEIVKINAQDSVYDTARLSHCFGSFIRHSGWYPDYVTRLFPRAKAQYDSSLVHEKLEYPSELQLRKLSGDLLHYTYRDINHYLVKSAGYAEAWSKQRYAKGKRATLLQGALHAVGCFVRMYILRAGFLDGKQGLLLALLSGHSTFVKYADLWVRERQA